MPRPLDPLPYVHRCWDDGTCPDYGKRLPSTYIHNEFEPRPEYEQEQSYYAGQRRP